MASVEIKVPGAGESISEGILSQWLKPDGAFVRSGDQLCELETDKASTPVFASTDGVLKHGATEGDTVEVGQTIGQIDPDAQPSASEEEPAPESKPESEAAPTSSARTEDKAAGEPSPSAAENRQAAGEPSPSARRLAEQEQVDLERVEGTGKGGRITKEDVLSHLDEQSKKSESESGSQAPPSAESPAAPRPSPESAIDGRGATGRQRRRRMPMIRQKIAQRLVEAQRTAAILTTFNEADMSAIMDLRSRYKESFKEAHGVGLGFMSFFVKATVEALKAFPTVNGYIDGNEIVENDFYNIGVAVSTDRGLLVPVIRDCDRLGFWEIERTIADFAQKARSNSISVDDLQGGTFTITNGGVFGSLLSTPILNFPQSGILGMHAIQKRPVVVDDQIVIRPMMYLAFSYDHRIIDGREAVRFLVRIKECVEAPERLMLSV